MEKFELRNDPRFCFCYLMNYLPRWLLLLLLTLILQWPGSKQLPLMDRDEPRFARATVEMMERSTLLVPYFNSEYRFDKPPLSYWWMRVHYLIGGVDEFSARLHSIIAAWLTACVILGLGRQLFDESTGMLAAVIWLTSLQVLIHGRLCVADMPMILFVTLAMRAVAQLMNLRALGDSPLPAQRWFWALCLSLAAGFLAKGPIALLVPILSIVLFRWWIKNASIWKQLRPLYCLLTVLGLVALWGVPALWETKGLFWKVGMGEHVVKRGAEMLNGRAFIPGYYLLTYFLSFYPWSGFTIGLWRHTRTHWSPTLAFLTAWFVAPLLLFSFYATQLPHYTLPGFPAVALLTAHALRCHDIKLANPAWLRLGLPLFFFLLGGSLCLFLLTDCGEDLHAMLKGVAWLLLAIGVCGWMAGKGLAMTKPRLSLLACMVLLGTTVHGLCQTIRDHSATLLALQVAQPKIGPQTACLGWNYTEPSLVFYSQRSWRFTGKKEQVLAFLKDHPDSLVLALRREWTLDSWLKKMLQSGVNPKESLRDNSDLLISTACSVDRLQRQIITGFNAARMSLVEVEIWRMVPP